MKKRILSIICAVILICMSVTAFPVSAEDSALTTGATDESTVVIIRAKKDIPEGTRITEDYVEAVTVSKLNVPGNVISEITNVVTQFATENIYEGEYISKDRISVKAVSKVNDSTLVKNPDKSTDDYLVVTDYIKADTGADISTPLQELIDKNPNRNIYFPDGEYVLGCSLLTSARGRDSVSILLSDGAVIKAANNWKKKSGNNALICLGGSEDYNNIKDVGSYYTLMGGTLDGNGKADGVCIVSGRESLVRNICIKNTVTGIDILNGTNNGSSDIDFEDITILGNGKLNTVGIKVDACDNTFTNIKIYNVGKGFDCFRGGNLIESIYVYTDSEEIMTSKTSLGIVATADNWVSECYVENYSMAYYFGHKTKSWDNTAAWTNDACIYQIAFTMKNSVSGTLSACKALFKDVPEATIAYVQGGTFDLAHIEGAMFDTALENDGTYKTRLKGLEDGAAPESLVVPVS